MNWNLNWHSIIACTIIICLAWVSNTAIRGYLDLLTSHEITTQEIAKTIREFGPPPQPPKKETWDHT